MTNYLQERHENCELKRVSGFINLAVFYVKTLVQENFQNRKFNKALARKQFNGSLLSCLFST